MGKTWEETALWAQLTERQKDPTLENERANLEAYLRRHMPQIAGILGHGDPMQDFTIHDEEHSFRVAERMVQLMPKDTYLTLHENALLLLSAFLHDIGMTPARGVVHRHYKQLLEGGHLNEVELAKFQRWLDDFDATVTIPLSAEDQDRLDRAGYLVAHYCRSQHNHWNADYIREKMADDQPYDGFVDVLIELCQSHHWGREDVERLKLFQAPGRPDGTINRLYLTLLLRVSDVMEVDPERVPEVIQSHREISPASEAYWYKDRVIDLEIKYRDEKRLIFLTSSPPTALIHHAVKQTADQIDQELTLACSLIQEARHALGDANELKRCKWDLPPAVHRSIEARNNCYVYINGSFRPDTQRMLKILGGIELYGTALAAVRELLQNALDAVRRRVAQQMLDEHELFCEAFVPEEARMRFGNSHHVELRIEEGADKRLWLICRDSGVGMTRGSIERRLLVSGSSRREEAELERQCKQAGFSAELTGQFGIGALSYFLLADRVEITTLPERNDSDSPNGWHFVTEGIGAFGQLTKAPPGTKPGTTVRLRLHRKLRTEEADIPLPNAAALRPHLESYVRDTVLWSPCNLVLREGPQSASAPPWASKPGWTRAPDEYASNVVQNIPTNHYPAQAITDDEVDRQKRESEFWEEQRTEAVRILKFEISQWKYEDLEIDARVRSLLPYFQYDDCQSIAFTPCTPVEFGPPQTAHTPGVFDQLAWKGMLVDNDLTDPEEPISDFWLLNGQIVEITISSWRRARISAHRNTLRVTKEDMSTLREHIRDKTKEIMLRKLESIHALPFGELSAAVSPARTFSLPPPNEYQIWPRKGAPPSRVAYPVAKIGSNYRRGACTWLGRPVTSLFGEVPDRYWARGCCADRLVIYNKVAALLWEKPPTTRGSGVTCSFPPEMNEIDRVVTSHEIDCFRADSPLANFLNTDDYQWAKSHSLQRGDIRKHFDDFREKPDRLAAWLALADWRYGPARRIAPLALELISELWPKVFPGVSSISTVAHDLLIEISPAGVSEKRYTFPSPADPEWRLDDVFAAPS